MDALDRALSPNAFRVSTVILAIVSGWFALTFLVTVGGAIAGA